MNYHIGPGFHQGRRAYNLTIAAARDRLWLSIAAAGPFRSNRHGARQLGSPPQFTHLVDLLKRSSQELSWLSEGIQRLTVSNSETNQSAIDQQRLTGDERRLVGRQKCHGSSDFVGPAGAA